MIGVGLKWGLGIVRESTQKIERIGFGNNEVSVKTLRHVYGPLTSRRYCNVTSSFLTEKQDFGCNHEHHRRVVNP